MLRPVGAVPGPGVAIARASPRTARPGRGRRRRPSPVVPRGRRVRGMCCVQSVPSHVQVSSTTSSRPRTAPSGRGRRRRPSPCRTAASASARETAASSPCRPRSRCRRRCRIAAEEGDLAAGGVIGHGRAASRERGVIGATVRPVGSVPNPGVTELGVTEARAAEQRHLAAGEVVGHPYEESGCRRAIRRGGAECGSCGGKGQRDRCGQRNAKHQPAPKQLIHAMDHLEHPFRGPSEDWSGACAPAARKASLPG